MPLNPYLMFNGNAREAATFYAEVFGSEPPQFMTYGQMDPSSPPEITDKIIHTFVTILDTKLMMSDDMGDSYREGNNFTLAYVGGDEEAIRSAFAKLADGGKVELELQETPWSKCYGQVVDKFGIKWQLSHEEGA